MVKRACGRGRVLHIRGVTYDAKVEAEQERLLKVRASALHAVGEGRCSVWLYGVKRQKDISFSASWPSPALTEIGLAEQRRFTSSYYVNWYMVIAGTSTGSVAQTAAKITAMLSDFKCETLSKPEDPEKPCPLSGFINYLVSGDHRPDLPALSSNLSGSLPGADLHLDRTTGLISTMTPPQAGQLASLYASCASCVLTVVQILFASSKSKNSLLSTSASACPERNTTMASPSIDCISCRVVSDFVILASGYTQELSTALLPGMWILLLTVAGLWIVIHGLQLAVQKITIIDVAHDGIYVIFATILLGGQGPDLVKTIYDAALGTMPSSHGRPLRGATGCGTRKGAFCSAG